MWKFAKSDSSVIRKKKLHSQIPERELPNEISWIQERSAYNDGTDQRTQGKKYLLKQLNRALKKETVNLPDIYKAYQKVGIGGNCN